MGNNGGAARWPPHMDEYGYFMTSSGTRDAHSGCAQGGWDALTHGHYQKE